MFTKFSHCSHKLELGLLSKTSHFEGVMSKLCRYDSHSMFASSRARLHQTISHFVLLEYSFEVAFGLQIVGMFGAGNISEVGHDRFAQEFILIFKSLNVSDIDYPCFCVSTVCNLSPKASLLVTYVGHLL